MFLVLCFLSLALIIALLVDNLLVNDNETTHTQVNFIEAEKTLYEAKLEDKEKSILLQEDGLHKLIGLPVNEIINIYGEPSRIDVSAYDYEWWIYPSSESYIQIGVDEGYVVTVYFIGSELLIAPFYIGQSYEEIMNEIGFPQQVSFNVKGNSYQFNLTEEELETRPLLFADHVFIQLYFDTFTKKLSGIRYLNGETLIKHRPYSVVYRGELIEAKPLSADQWRDIEYGASLQILAITNEIRKRHDLNKLEWDEETSIVAFHHSEDMSINEYFSHTSPSEGELKDRLKKQGVLYQLAGENIAAKYVDSIAVVEGWLNSEGHRVNLLHEEFTHLGVGVYERYYTQNFITPW
ncbi:hypothetical protein DS745_17465 [Anaerobacillus alkaliphilus]|uniref:CAP domain-containing protein n=2 Tax=Anaerobacillus alkaliphilus TaxID=1548597 RepID=A0A4Q0VQC9_9BACI|nr:hypothetical protein DS745_17465 [Anaerobacillus alkaliphilus]